MFSNYLLAEKSLFVNYYVVFIMKFKRNRG